MTNSGTTKQKNKTTEEPLNCLPMTYKSRVYWNDYYVQFVCQTSEYLINIVNTAHRKREQWW